MCEVCRNGGDDDAGLDRNEVDANEGQTYPRVMGIERASGATSQIENLIGVGEPMIEHAKALVKAAEAAIHASGMARH